MSTRYPFTTHRFSARRPVAGPLKSTQLADAVPDDELRRLDQVGTMVTVKKTTGVMQQSVLGRQCLVVVDGVLRVDRDGAHLADLGAGDVAGEIGFLTSRPCNATVVAESGTTVYAMNRREFATLLVDCPAFREELWRAARDRIPVS